MAVALALLIVPLSSSVPGPPVACQLPLPLSAASGFEASKDGRRTVSVGWGTISAVALSVSNFMSG